MLKLDKEVITSLSENDLSSMKGGVMVAPNVPDPAAHDLGHKPSVEACLSNKHLICPFRTRKCLITENKNDCNIPPIVEHTKAVNCFL